LKLTHRLIKNIGVKVNILLELAETRLKLIFFL